MLKMIKSAFGNVKFGVSYNILNCQNVLFDSLDDAVCYKYFVKI